MKQEELATKIKANQIKIQAKGNFPHHNRKGGSFLKFNRIILNEVNLKIFFKYIYYGVT